MVTGEKRVGINSTITANGTTTADFSLQMGARSLIVCCEASNLTDGSYTVKLQHSPDGVTFEDVGSATAALTADGFKIVRISETTLPILRLELTASAVTTGADIICSVYFSSKY